MIKYIGSKRRLVPVLGDLFGRSGAMTALDLFTGTTRVAQEMKRRGGSVTAVDTARYSAMFSSCYVETDARTIDEDGLAEAIAYLDSRPGRPGFVTDTYCVRSRFFQPFNGERIDSIRDAIEAEFAGTALYPILLTSLIEAADRVDSTTGVQMAYVKSWAPRSFRPLRLRRPELLEGPGRSLRGDACALLGELAPVDLAYLDPPYNQHRYVTNYHLWETIVAWDEPETYGVACKRVDCRDDATKSVFNSKRSMPDALSSLLGSLEAEVVVVSYNDESWVGVDELTEMCSSWEATEVLSFDQDRYVGAKIGIHSPSGEKVGAVGRLTNREYLVVAGPSALVEAMIAPYEAARLDRRAATA